MTRVRVFSTALIFLTISGTSAVHAQGDQGRGRGRGRVDQSPPPPPVTAAEQKRRAQEEQQRASQAKQQMDQQVRAVQQQNVQLQAQNRAAQYRNQQEYAAQLRQQQQRIQTQRDYSRDPYVSTPHNYRYNVDGAYRQTNEYGAAVLRQAVNDGYQQGYRTGLADYQDRWASNFQNSPAYRDASYGFAGNYVDLSDYRYYFREGFARGYTDGYNRESRYGTVSNGTTAILATVLTAILGLQSIH